VIPAPRGADTWVKLPLKKGQVT